MTRSKFSLSTGHLIFAGFREHRSPLTGVRACALLAAAATLLVGCGSMPVPSTMDAPFVLFKSDETSVAKIESDKSAAPRVETKVQARAKAPESAVDARVEVNENRAVSFKTAGGYAKHAINLLQDGEVADAEWALNEALKLDANDSVAQKLLHQIHADPVVELGVKSFDYAIETGDSMSKLAKEYLNDPLLFHILAKYNDIVNPGQIAIGQVIKIPGQKPAPTVAQKAPEKRDVSPLDLAKKELQGKNYTAAIKRLESVVAETVEGDADTAKAQTMLVEAYMLEARKQIDGNNVDQARRLIEKAADMEPNNKSVVTALADLDDLQKIESIYQEGLLAFNQGQSDVAYKSFSRVVQLKANYKDAAVRRDSVKEKAADVMYKQALKAQRRQELAEAIGLWDEVLVIDPKNENAKLYRAKAIELQQNLEKFAGQD